MRNAIQGNDLKIEKQKSYGCFEYKNLPFYKLWAQMDENCKRYS